MCLRFAFLLTARVLSWLRLSQREDTWKTAEILTPRHQLAVLQRQQPRRPNLNGANANPSPLVAGSLGTRAEIDRAVSSTSPSNSTAGPPDLARSQACTTSSTKWNPIAPGAGYGPPPRISGR